MRKIIDNSDAAPKRRDPISGITGTLRKAYLEGYRPDLYAALIASEHAL